MPVSYNIAANQRLPDPQAALKGKAIRSGIASQEKQREALQQSIDMAPAQESRKDRLLRVQEDQEARLREQFEVLKGTKEGEDLNKYLDVAITGYEQAKADGKTEEEANAFAWEIGLDHLDQVTPGSREEAAAQAEASGFTPEAFDIRKLKALAGDKPKNTTVLSLDEKLDMGMSRDWAKNTVVERDQDGNLTVNNRPTGTTPEDLARDPRTPGQQGKAYQDAKDSYDGSSAIQEQIGAFLPRAQSLPDSVGGVARMAQSVSAAVGLLGNDASAEAIANAMTATDQETLASMRAQLQLIRGRIRPLVTGDYGKRQSDKELEISNKVLGLAETIDSPLDLLKNYPQVMGGLKELYGATLIEQYQQAKKTDGIEYPYDLSTDEGIEEIATVMNSQGIDNDNIVRFIKRLQTIQEVTL